MWCYHMGLQRKCITSQVLPKTPYNNIISQNTAKEMVRSNNFKRIKHTLPYNYYDTYFFYVQHLIYDHICVSML